MAKPFSADGGYEILLVLASSRSLKSYSLETLRQLNASGFSVVIISVTLPYIVIRKVYRNEGIDLSRIYVIDAVTKYSGGEVTDTDGRCTFISNPGNLTDIGIAMTETLRSMPEGKKCVIVDDIATMLLYSSSATFMKFIHFLTNRLRILEVQGILFAVEKGLAPTIQAQLSTFSDSVFRTEDA